MDFIPIIMAGGQGKRFWPLSTEKRPKQFLDLTKSGQTMLQATVTRLLPLVGSIAELFIVSSPPYLDLIREQVPELPETNLIVEPTGRDTAPAIALAALELTKRFDNPIMGVFPSDHHIGDMGAFQQTLTNAIKLTEQTHGLITLGITPTHPATGYGYIEQGHAAKVGYTVSRFVEKPDEATAQRYLATGGYSWNSGMFLWHTDSILCELRRYVPELLAPLEQAHRDGCIDTVFPALPKISIDYAVLERTKRAYVLPAEFGWDDLGDWLALERHLDTGLLEAHVGVDSGGNIVYTETEDDVIVTLGVKDMVIVKRGNTVLIADKYRSQEIKKVLEHERIVKLKPTAD